MNIPTTSQLEEAIAIRKEIERLQQRLMAVLNAEPVTPTPTGSKKTGGMSAASRAKIAAAQKARWAKVKAGKSVASKPAVKTAKGKRTMSAATRMKIAAAAKKRWAKTKAAGKKRL